MKFSLGRLIATGFALFLALNAQAQGVVNFANAFGINVSTNADFGVSGITAGTANGFYYGLFLAPSTVTSIDLSLQDLLTPTWTFTGAYGTNTSTPGRLKGSSIISGWQPGVTNTYFILGWSSNLGHDWSVIGNELQGADFDGNNWAGGHFVQTASLAFIGGSMARAGGGGLPFGEAGGAVGTDTYPSFNLFGTAPNPQGSPSVGFTLYTMFIPEPCGSSLFSVGLVLMVIRKWKVGRLHLLS